MPRYSVRVVRIYEEEYADLEVEARGPKEAKEKAVKEARGNACLYFGATPEPEFFADASMDPEKVN